jgi:hypothetical protein
LTQKLYSHKTCGEQKKTNKQYSINYVINMNKDFGAVERRRHFRRQEQSLTTRMIKRHMLLVYGDAI